MELPFNYLGTLATAELLDGSDEERILAELDQACLDDLGRLKVMPADFYAGRTQLELSIWCVRRGFYCLPTSELIDWLRVRIEDERAIEISAGHGAIGRALGIPITDSRLHENPSIVRHYESIEQGVTRYPDDVERLTATEACEKYKPSIVIGAWVVHRYDPRQHDSQGGVQGVDEFSMLMKPFVTRYIHIGHRRVHGKKPLLRKLAPTEHALPGLYDRPSDPGAVVWEWVK